MSAVWLYVLGLVAYVTGLLFWSPMLLVGLGVVAVTLAGHITCGMRRRA